MTEASLKIEHDITIQEFQTAEEQRAFERGYQIGRLHAEYDAPEIKQIELFEEESA